MSWVNAIIVGRKVEEIIVDNALAIADTNFKTRDVDTSKFKQITLLVRTTLDQPVEMHIKAGASGTALTAVRKESAWVTTDSAITIPANTSGWLIINTQATWLDRGGFYQLGISFRCQTVPTNGAISIKVWGVPN